MDMGIALRLAIPPLVNRDVPLHMYTDSKSLFDTITRRSQTQEKRLLIDLATVRDAYRSKEISNVAWIRSEYNLADPMTKHCSNHFLEVIDTGVLDHPVEQWIFRKKEVDPKVGSPKGKSRKKENSGSVKI